MDFDQFSSPRINDLCDILFCELAFIWACPYVKTPGRAFRYKSSPRKKRGCGLSALIPHASVDL